MDEQGLEQIWLFPTLGMLYEELLKDDPEAVDAHVHRVQPLARRGLGLRLPRTRSSPRRTSRSADVDWAVAELEWALDRGARVDRACGPRRRPPATGQRPPARPDVRSVLGAGERGRHHRRRARRRQRLHVARLREGRVLGRVRRGRRASVDQDADDRARDLRLPRCRSSFDQLFERFPNVRIASVENGSEFLPDLFQKLRSAAAQDPGLLPRGPGRDVPAQRVDQPVLGGRRRTRSSSSWAPTG